MVNKVSNGNDDSPEALTEEDIEFSGEDDYVISGASKPKTRLIRLVNPHQALVFKTGRDSGYRIPQPVVSLDEKYLRGCLESIHFRASMMTSDALLVKNLIVTPLETGTREGFGSPGVLVGPAGRWILGSGPVLTGESLSSLSSSSDDRPIGEPRPRALSVSSSPMRRLDMGGCAPPAAAEERLRRGADRGRTPASATSTESWSSDRVSPPGTVCQGMIKRSGGAAFQRFVFSVDDRREVYVATLSPGGKGADPEYSFHEISGGGSHSRPVGRMTVSTSIVVDGDGSRLSETEFVLSTGGGGGDLATSSSSSSPSPLAKHRGGLSRKVAGVFKLSKLGGPVPAREDEDLDGQDREMAAIVVREAREEEGTRSGGGGWGLKFLERVKAGGGGDRSGRSVDVLVPAGPHGGPGGSSSIVERWRSGGRCDCGGWDMGCPLTVLTPKSNNPDEGSLLEEFKSFDLIAQGSGHSAPKLRVVTLRDDLYFVHFQRTLSIIQSFSIAVAIIHTRSPSLRPKDVHEL